MSATVVSNPANAAAKLRDQAKYCNKAGVTMVMDPHTPDGKEGLHWLILMHFGPNHPYYKNQHAVISIKGDRGAGTRAEGAPVYFPQGPPKVVFLTTQVHVNIQPKSGWVDDPSSKGSICVDVVRDIKSWVPSTTIFAIAEQIKLVFEFPGVDSTWDFSTAAIWKRSAIADKAATAALNFHHAEYAAGRGYRGPVELLSDLRNGKTVDRYSPVVINRFDRYLPEESKSNAAELWGFTSDHVEDYFRANGGGKYAHEMDRHYFREVVPQLANYTQVFSQLRRVCCCPRVRCGDNPSMRTSDPGADAFLYDCACGDMLSFNAIENTRKVHHKLVSHMPETGPFNTAFATAVKLGCGGESALEELQRADDRKGCLERILNDRLDRMNHVGETSLRMSIEMFLEKIVEASALDKIASSKAGSASDRRRARHARHRRG